MLLRLYLDEDLLTHLTPVLPPQEREGKGDHQRKALPGENRPGGRGIIGDDHA